MPNRDTDRTYGRAGALAFAVLFSFAGLGQPAAQTPSPLAGSFDELFANPTKVAPLFNPSGGHVAAAAAADRERRRRPCGDRIDRPARI